MLFRNRDKFWSRPTLPAKRDCRFRWAQGTCFWIRRSLACPYRIPASPMLFAWRQIMSIGAERQLGRTLIDFFREGVPGIRESLSGMINANRDGPFLSGRLKWSGRLCGGPPPLYVLSLAVQKR